MDRRSDRHLEIARAKGMRTQREVEMGASGGGNPSGPAAMWPHQKAGHKLATDRVVQTQKAFLTRGGRSLIAAPLSRPSFTSPARVMVLFAVSVGCRNIWSGPEDRHCKVHNGLTLITRPSPRRAIACTLALGRCVLAYLTSFDELRCHGRRGPAERLAGSPDTVQDHGQLARQGDPCFA